MGSVPELVDIKEDSTKKYRVRVQSFGATQKDSVEPGDVMGIIAVFTGIPREYSNVCVQNAVVWTLDGISLRHIIAKVGSDTMRQSEEKSQREALMECTALRGFSHDDMKILTPLFQIKYFPPGSCILDESVDHPPIYIVQSGRVKCRVRDNSISEDVVEMELRESQMFGASLTSSRNEAFLSVQALTDDVFCFTVPVEHVRSSLTNNFMARGVGLQSLGRSSSAKRTSQRSFECPRGCV